MRRITGLTDAVLRYLRVNGIFAWVNPTIGVYDKDLEVKDPKTGLTKKGSYRTMRNTTKGVPDILATDNGQLIGIELKTSDRLSPDQVNFAVNLLIHGAYICIIRSVDDLFNSLRFWGYVINDNGMMTRGIIDRTYMDTHHNIPNANLIPQLKYIDQPQWLNLSQVALVKHTFGEYAERIITSKNPWEIKDAKEKSGSIRRQSKQTLVPPDTGRK